MRLFRSIVFCLCLIAALLLWLAGAGALMVARRESGDRRVPAMLSAIAEMLGAMIWALLALAVRL
jgi:hypothetical protein